MDFSKSNFGTVDAIERSVKVHLANPFDKTQLIYDADLESPILDANGKHLKDAKGNLRYNDDLSKPVCFGLKFVRCVAGKSVAKRFDRMAAKGVTVDPQKLLIDVLTAVTTGWSNVDDENGPMPATEDNVRAFLTEYVDFLPQLSAVASDIENYGVDADFFTM